MTLLVLLLAFVSIGLLFNTARLLDQRDRLQSLHRQERARRHALEDDLAVHRAGRPPLPPGTVVVYPAPEETYTGHQLLARAGLRLPGEESA